MEQTNSLPYSFILTDIATVIIFFLFLLFKKTTHHQGYTSHVEWDIRKVYETDTNNAHTQNINLLITFNSVENGVMTTH